MKLSLFSVSYAGLWGQHTLDLPDFIAKAASLGYDTVTLMGKRPHLSPLDHASPSLEALKQNLEQHGITCDVVAGYNDFCTAGTAGEVPYLEMQIAYIASLCETAQTLGAKIVRVFTAYESNAKPLTAIWKDTVAALRECCDRAAEHGVTLAVQNHHDLGVHSNVLLELLHDVDKPNAKLSWDAWSPALRGEDLYETARRMAPHTLVTTNADYVRLPRFQYQPELINYQRVEPDLVRAVRFGEGDIDYEAFFAGLIDGGFNGIAAYEMCSPLRGGGSLENLDACAKHYVTWMRNHLKK